MAGSELEPRAPDFPSSESRLSLKQALYTMEHPSRELCKLHDLLSRSLDAFSMTVVYVTVSGRQRESSSPKADTQR